MHAYTTNGLVTSSVDGENNTESLPRVAPSSSVAPRSAPTAVVPQRDSVMGLREAAPVPSSVPLMPPPPSLGTPPFPDDGGAEEDVAAAASTDVSALLRTNGGDTAPAFCVPSIPRAVMVLLVLSALVQGFSASVVAIFMNRELALQPAEVAAYWAYVGSTVWCQPLLGYVSDAVVVLGEKRRPLLLAASVGNAALYIVYGLCVAATRTFGRFVALSMLSQLCTMCLYIPLNGLVVEVGRHDAETAEESNARMSAIMAKTMLWRSAGSLVGAVLHTALVVWLPVRVLLGVTGLLYLALVPAALAAPRVLFLRAAAPTGNWYTRVVQAGRLVWRGLDVRDMRSDGVCFLLVLLFVFAYTMMPDAGSVYYSYLYVTFAFPNWFYSMNGCVGHLGSIAGAYVYSCWMERRAVQETRGGARTSLFFIFSIGSAAWAVGYVTNLLLCTGVVTDTLRIPAALYVPVDTFATSLLARFAFMPTLAMAAEHAPKHLEATTFEVFSVASMGGGIVSSLLTSTIARGLHITREDYTHLWALVLVSVAAKLAPIPLAYLLPERRPSRGGGSACVGALGSGGAAAHVDSALLSDDGEVGHKRTAAREGPLHVGTAAEQGWCGRQGDTAPTTATR
ncbi:BT1 family [Novymonas esmeraldas]|uniref:BT1 family n=1 Tax=Novymonas esmeraldas TaxID=1808958 RepID=A0AAW0F015_9TRYP